MVQVNRAERLDRMETWDTRGDPPRVRGLVACSRSSEPAGRASPWLAKSRESNSNAR